MTRENSAAPHRRTVAGPSGDLSYLVWGRPTGSAPLVLLQPVNAAAAVWDDTARLLAGGLEIYAIDYRAHGESEPGGPYLPADYAADTLAMMDAEGIAATHVAGGSIGGAVSVELATLAPGRVLSIAFFGAAVRIGVSDEQMTEMASGLRSLGIAGWFAEHGAGIIGSASVPGVAETLVDLASRGRDVETVVEVVRGTFRLADSRPAIARIGREGPPPALVVTGTEDPTCPPAMARDIAGHLGTSAVLLDGIGHLPMLEAPQLTATLLRGFLGGLTPASDTARRP